MADFKYKITLLTDGINPLLDGGLSGPTYAVTYTTASVYNSAISGSPAYLPNSGSVAYVNIPSGSFSYLAFKLTSSGSCTNNVIFTVIGSAPAPTPAPTPSPTPTPTPTPTPSPTPSLSFSSTRFFFGNTTGDCCIATASAAYYVPNAVDPIFGIPQYIYQNAGGTVAFSNPYFTDGVIGLPSPTHNYNTASGQVGSYVTSCL